MDAIEKQNKNFYITFALLAKLAIADGSVDKSEANEIYSLIDNVLKLGAKRKEVAIKIFNDEKNSSIGYAALAHEFKNNNAPQKELMEWMMDILFRLAMANGELAPAEEKLINDVAKILDVDSGTLQKIKNNYVTTNSPLETSYEELGCKPNASLQEVEAKYNSLLQQYDPERMKFMGMPEEFLAVANEKVARFKQAYEKIRSAS